METIESKQMPKHGGRKTTAAKPERQMEALRLRTQGFTYRDIAKHLNVSLKVAWSYVQSALDEAREEVKEEARHLREIENERLDKMQAHWWVKAVNGDHHAVDIVLRVMRQRAQLNGLDEPEKIDLTNGLILLPPPVPFPPSPPLKEIHADSDTNEPDSG